MKIRDFLFGKRSDIFEDLEKDAEKDLELLRDILFLHFQKIKWIRLLVNIWDNEKKIRKIKKIDKIAKWIEENNEKLLKLIKKMQEIQSLEDSIIELLIVRNAEVAGEFRDYDLNKLLSRMEGELRLLRTVLIELDFIIKQQIKYLTQQGKGIVIILKEIGQHKNFYQLLVDEIEVDKKLRRLVQMLHTEALVLHKEKEFKAKGPLVIEEVYSPYSHDFIELYTRVYIQAFPDPGELLALEDLQEELGKRYKSFYWATYHILMIKAGTIPVGGIMFDLYQITKDYCVGVIYYYFVKKELLENVERGNQAAIMLFERAKYMIKRDAIKMGLKLGALFGEVDSPKRKTEWRLNTELKRRKLKPEEAQSYMNELIKIARMYSQMGFRKVDFNFTPNDLSHKRRILTYLDLYLLPLRKDWKDEMKLHSSHILRILFQLLDYGYGLNDTEEKEYALRKRRQLFNRMKNEISKKVFVPITRGVSEEERRMVKEGVGAVRIEKTRQGKIVMSMEAAKIS